MFNRKASDPKNRPDQIIETLALRPGQNIADIGAGGGYFSLRFSEAVGSEGKVYAVDTDRKSLNFLANEAEKRVFTNIETVLVTEGRLHLPERSLDLAFIRNTYHHLTDRVQYFARLACLLKPSGRVAIVEYRRATSLSFRGLFKHYVPQEHIVDEMQKAGYRLDRVFGFLPEQSFTIFSVTD
jgi:arsenite methyltransferase